MVSILGIAQTAGGRHILNITLYLPLMRIPKLTSALVLAMTLAGCGVNSDGSMGSAATLMALNALGMQAIQPLPLEGCTGSAIPPERVVELLMAIPEEQRALLAQVLSASSAAWSVQLYTGSAGMGFCFPVENTLVLLPAKTATTTSTTTSTTVIIPPDTTTVIAN